MGILAYIEYQFKISVTAVFAIHMNKHIHLITLRLIVILETNCFTIFSLQWYYCLNDVWLILNWAFNWFVFICNFICKPYALKLKTYMIFEEKLWKWPAVHLNKIMILLWYLSFFMRSTLFEKKMYPRTNNHNFLSKTF